MNISFQLYQLQSIDTKIDQISKRLGAIKNLIKNNQKVKSAEKILDQKKSKLVEKNNSFQEINSQIEKKKIKKTQSQSSLYSGKVQNPKELEDLQHEIDSLNKAIISLEENLMQALVVLDEAEKDLEAAKENLKSAKSEVATESAMLSAEKEKLELQLIGLNNKRVPIYESIDSEYKAKYEELRTKKMGIAVTILNENCCKACGTNLTASEQQSARASSQIFICPNCGRIIYGS